MIDRGSLSPDQLRTANGGRLKSISFMSKRYQLTDSIEPPWRHSRSVFYFSLDTSFFFIDELFKATHERYLSEFKAASDRLGQTIEVLEKRWGHVLALNFLRKTTT